MSVKYSCDLCNLKQLVPNVSTVFDRKKKWVSETNIFQHAFLRRCKENVKTCIKVFLCKAGHYSLLKMTESLKALMHLSLTIKHVTEYVRT